MGYILINSLNTVIIVIIYVLKYFRITIKVGCLQRVIKQNNHFGIAKNLNFLRQPQKLIEQQNSHM